MRQNGEGGTLPLELGASFGFLNNSEFLLTWWLARNALPLLGAWQTCPIVLAAAVVWKKRLSSPSSTASEFVRSGITSGSGRLTSNQSSSCYSTLTILPVARIVIWTTRKKELYDDANISHCDLILFFRHQLRVRCDRKRLDRITFDKRWLNPANLVVRK